MSLFKASNVNTRFARRALFLLRALEHRFYRPFAFLVNGRLSGTTRCQGAALIPKDAPWTPSRSM